MAWRSLLIEAFLVATMGWTAPARATALAPPDEPAKTGDVVVQEEIIVAAKMIKPEVNIFTVLKGVNFEPPQFIRSFLKGITESVESPALDAPKE